MWASPHCHTPKMTVPGASRSLRILLGAFSCFSLGTQGDQAHIHPQQVNGILGGSASLPVLLSSGSRVTKIEWRFTKKGGTRAVPIARFENGEFNQSSSGRFKERLEMDNETTLMIKDLEMEDSGQFEARVRLATAEVEVHPFSLSVSEPVPEPRITVRWISNTPDGCNVTLQCQAFGQEGLNVSWETGNPLRKLEGGSVWYQLSENGSEIHMSWQLKSLASNLTCLASSPVDQKKVSINLQSVCSIEGGSRAREMWWRHYLTTTTIVFLFTLATVWVIRLWKKKGKKSSKKTGSV